MKEGGSKGGPSGTGVRSGGGASSVKEGGLAMRISNPTVSERLSSPGNKSPLTLGSFTVPKGEQRGSVRLH